MTAGLTPLTDDELEVDRKNDEHKRAKRIGRALTAIMVYAMYFLAALVAAAILYCSGLYGLYLYSPEKVSAGSINIIEKLATHLGAALVGYIGHLARISFGRNGK